MRKSGFLCLTAITIIAGALSSFAADQSILLQSTTSTANSGLYDYLLPLFTEKTGVQVHVVCRRHGAGHQECHERRW